MLFICRSPDRRNTCFPAPFHSWDQFEEKSSYLIGERKDVLSDCAIDERRSLRDRVHASANVNQYLIKGFKVDQARAMFRSSAVLSRFLSIQDEEDNESVTLASLDPHRIEVAKGGPVEALPRQHLRQSVTAQLWPPMAMGLLAESQVLHSGSSQ